MEDLSITIIQSELFWHDVEANLASFEEKIWSVEEATDLIILPEMFNTGFTLEARAHAELMNGRTFKWMKNMARQSGAVITGSYIIWEKDHYYNRLIWMKPDGSFSKYDKRHLFRMAEEDKSYSSGKYRLIEEIRGWRVSPFICYDLRFPVWSKNRMTSDNQQLEYDLAIFIANWPAARINAWDILLKARAVENFSYVAGINRVGTDGNGVIYNGHSMVVGPKGESCLTIRSDPFIKTIILSGKSLVSYRKKFPAYLDSDNFIVN